MAPTPPPDAPRSPRTAILTWIALALALAAVLWLVVQGQRTGTPVAASTTTSATDSAGPSPTQSPSPSDSTSASSTQAPPTVSTSPTDTATASVSAAPPVVDTAGWYAVLDAPGWAAVDGDAISTGLADFTLVGGTATAQLNWRGEHGAQPKFSPTPSLVGKVGTAVLARDQAGVFAYGDGFLVVGPVRDGRMLTLATTGLTLAETSDLAALVRRQ